VDENKKLFGALQRREFIKMGAGSFALSLTGCATSSAPESPAPVKSDKAGLARPPEVGELVDPERLQTETWQEPWVWRPDRWPDDALELNVVASQNPGLSPSPGNPTPSLFSYNGSSPGPTVRVRMDGEVRFRVRNMLSTSRPTPPEKSVPSSRNRYSAAILRTRAIAILSFIRNRFSKCSPMRRSGRVGQSRNMSTAFMGHMSPTSILTACMFSRM
jgi:hypothetical protein